MSAYESYYPTGAPAGYTGSPGDGNNCTSCHGGTATTSPGWITSDIPGSGYIPGVTYQITATNSLAGNGKKYGFEVSPQNTSGTLLGTLTAGTGTQLVGNGKYVTHSLATLVTNSWTFSWTAPVAGTGNVTFYGAFARGNPGLVTLSTLTVNEALNSPAPAGPISGPSTICVAATGNYTVGTIAGATDYVWSVPAGATITSGQGTTAITVNFGVNAVSGNVSVYGSNSAGNGTASNLSVIVNEPPSVATTPTGPLGIDLLTVTQSEYITTGATGAASYTWEITPAEAGTIIGSGLTANVTWGNYAGSASIRVKALNECGSGNWSQAITVEIYNSVGINEPAEQKVLSVYPSPSDGHITIDLRAFSGDVALRVADLTGRLWIQSNVRGGEEISLNLDIPRGIYLMQADDGTLKAGKKLMIR
ncbi:MAG: hypothetical protein A2X11_01880 [Bacteroidetes bacterium GWE2_42_24]|nr:MAG: hypothetical protein A2X11_01880 [Bacteroidetes bacterium GWE2_42_24]OFY29688.1 MAG: hypothetical protein A2X09_01290 [Bacteroidetes bacterium GWF2_43_11]